MRDKIEKALKKIFKQMQDRYVVEGDFSDLEDDIRDYSVAAAKDVMKVINNPR